MRPETWAKPEDKGGSEPWPGAEGRGADGTDAEGQTPPEPARPDPALAGTGIQPVFIGPHGLRAGWSVLLFIELWTLMIFFIGGVFATFGLISSRAGFTPRNLFFGELSQLIALAGAVAFLGLLEGRRLKEYNLTGLRPSRNFLSGLAIGFVALSLLVGAMTAGGWMRFGGAAISGGEVLRWGLFWALFFLMVGCVEEGSFRCYLQSTFTRGLNFWWALGAVAFLCLDLPLKAATRLDLVGIATLGMVRPGPAGAWGVYAAALLGLIPCYILHRKAAAHSAFWQAAWVTSTLFGFVHTGNGGENWIGIFAAAGIGFVFCVSIRVTGSAWWAIGCHTGWDWAETYFYGTPDSGLVARGHLLTTTHAGNVLWSGGSDGPEGSLLVIGVIFLLLVWLLMVYGRGRPATRAAV